MNNLKNIGEKILKLKDKFKTANIEQKKQVKLLAIISICFLVLIIFVQVISLPHNNINHNPVITTTSSTEISFFDLEKIQSSDINISNRGIGFDVLDPVGSIVNPINDAITSVVKQVVGLYDNYVAFTPNIANSDGNIKGVDGSVINIPIDKFYSLLSTIAWILLPLVIMINGAMIVLEGSFRGRELAMQIAKKLLLFAVGMILMRFILSLGIDLINAINGAVIKGLIGNGAKLSDALLNALGINTGSDGKLAFQDQGTFNIFSQLIIWIGLFFLMITILFQFIIRFFHILLHMIMFPISMIVGLLPGGGQFFKTYIEEIIRSLSAQPVFLVGLGIVIAIIQSGTGSVTKLVLGIGSLLFLNTINSLVARFSGMLWTGAGLFGAGLVTAATVGTAKIFKRGAVRELTGESSGSIRMAGARFLARQLPFAKGDKGNFNTNFSKPTFSSPSTLMDNQKNPGAFKKSLGTGRSNSQSAFASLGMNPLKTTDLTNTTGKTSLYSTRPNFSPISNLSAKDSKDLSTSFNKSHYDSYMGDYPLTDKPVKFNQFNDMNAFHPSNPETLSKIDSVIPIQQKEIAIKNMFDTTNPTHSNHMHEWYAKNESASNNMKFEDALKFSQNPTNQMDVLRRASSEGYFKAQGIHYVKAQDHINGETINKFYQLRKDENAGNSTTKIKSK